MIKTKKTRQANQLAAQQAAYFSPKWKGVVPKSMALANHCKCRNYGRNTWQEDARRECQRDGS